MSSGVFGGCETAPCELYQYTPFSLALFFASRLKFYVDRVPAHTSTAPLSDAAAHCWIQILFSG